MEIAEICLAFTAAVSVFLLCANVFLIFRHFSTKKKHEEEKKQTSILLSTTAHDLRSPLTSIKGFADAMLDGTIRGEDSEIYLTLISSESDRLARLSSRLCQGENFELEPRDFGLCETIRRAYILVMQKAKTKDLNVEFSFTDDDEFYVRADEDAVFEIILNLFENAVKYCNDAGKISWKVTSDSSFTTVTVRNSTDLLPDIPDIFFPGARMETTKRTGFGLGLYISKKLAKKSGTDLFFEKGKDENSAFCSFSFSLPVSDKI